MCRQSVLRLHFEQYHQNIDLHQWVEQLVLLARLMSSSGLLDTPEARNNLLHIVTCSCLHVIKLT